MPCPLCSCIYICPVLHFCPCGSSHAPIPQGQSGAALVVFLYWSLRRPSPLHTSIYLHEAGEPSRISFRERDMVIRAVNFQWLAGNIWQDGRGNRTSDLDMAVDQTAHRRHPSHIISIA
ncbi:hypothetical protein GMDG_07016 [Pseudogymnoascus destructans 20631-21]|uniref:Uncharacterized protein n=1 Tax=Pseudogymnoascus destructans (strain ATCC MYA-4855 / 20631-21) TaxID=658429 RepID=L8FW71_PSED2|nr:hypothetical protein GMDG_07016 [Pseudogymnoascus destructans 20631-21]